MAAVQPGDQMEHQLVLALQHVRVSAAANAELGAENVRLQARATRAEKAVLALTIALRSKDVQLRATTAEIPALEQQLAALASQHSAAAPAAAAQGTASQDMPVDGAEAAARVEAEEKLAFVVAALGKLQGKRRRRLHARLDSSASAMARSRRRHKRRGGGHGGHGGGHCGGVVRGDDRGGGGSAGGGSRRGRDVAAFAASRAALVPRKRSAAPCDSHWRRTRRRRSRRRLPRRRRRGAAAVPQAPAAPPLERPVWRVGFLAPPKSAPAVPAAPDRAPPLGVSSEPEPTFAPEAGPVLPAAPTGKEQPSDVSVTGAPTTAGAYQVSIAPPAEGAASGAPWRVTIDPTPTQPAAEAEPPAPVPAPTPAPKDDYRCVSVTPRSASGDDGPWRAASPPGGASESAPADQSEVAPWRVSLNPPAAGGQGWTVSIKPPGGAAEAVVRAPVQEAVVHMMQDGDGHASVQIVAAVAADELVSDALRAALATQTAVPSAAVVEARAAGSEVVAAALNGLSAA